MVPTAIIAPCPTISRGDGLHRPHRARIGDRNRGALKILRRQLAAARAAHQIVQRRDVLLKIHLAGILEIRHQKIARAVLAGHIHRDAQIDGLAHHAKRLAVLVRESVVQARKIFQCPHDRPADDVRIRNLAPAQQRAVMIDDAPVLVDHFDRNGALRSRDRNGQARVHVFGDPRRRPPQRRHFFPGLGRQRRWMPISPRVFKHVFPAVVHRPVVVQILLVKLVFEPAIDA